MEAQIQQLLKQIEGRLDKIESRIDQIESKMDMIRNDQVQMHYTFALAQQHGRARFLNRIRDDVGGTFEELATMPVLPASAADQPVSSLPGLGPPPAGFPANRIAAWEMTAPALRDMLDAYGVPYPLDADEPTLQNILMRFITIPH